MNELDLKSRRPADLILWSYALLALAVCCMGWAVFAVGNAMFGSDFDLALLTTDGAVLLTEQDFTPSQRLMTVAICCLTDLCWFCAFVQIAKMALRFSRGEILTEGVVGCLERFGYWLLAASVTEFFLLPTLFYYLQSIGKVGQPEKLWLGSISESIITVLASVLVLLLAKVFRVGVELREVAELTI